jgi:hypothetical protein
MKPTTEPTQVVSGDARSSANVCAALCLATLLVFVPFNAASIDPGPLFAGFAKAPLAYTLILLPHVVTLIACVMAPTALTFGLATGVGAMGIVAMIVEVPLISLSLGLSRERQDGGILVLCAVVLFVLQVALYRTARRAAQLKDLRGSVKAKRGTFIAPLFVAIVIFIIVPKLAAMKQARQAKIGEAYFQRALQEKRVRFTAAGATVSTHEDLEERLQFIRECVGEASSGKKGYPRDIRSLGPGGTNCLDSVTASGLWGKWRVAYSPRGYYNGSGYVLTAIDTTKAEHRMIIAQGDTTVRIRSMH